MQTDDDIYGRLIDSMNAPSGIRTDASRIIEQAVAGGNALFGFVAVEDAESGELLIAAANGLDAATYRRLETRVSRSALIRVIDTGEPFDLLVNDEPTLDFLLVDGAVPEIFSVPIAIDEATVGFVSIAIDKSMRQDRRSMRRLLNSAASLVRLSIIIERNRRDHESREQTARDQSRSETLNRFSLDNLIGNSSRMRQAIGQVRQVARSNANVLIRGDVGTGKAVIAATIHHNSLRSKQPIVEFNAGSHPLDLTANSMFGSVQIDGTLTRGAIDDADGGTLYIDEIAGLDREVQRQIVNLIETRLFVRVGSDSARQANVRLIAGSRKPLEELTANGVFSQRLFDRLGMFTIFLPPLSERKSDVLLLAEHFIERYSATHGKRIKRISTSAIDMLAAYHFPGNVRELENAIERAVIACDSNVIHGRHLPPTLQTAEATLTETRLSLGDAVAAFERDLIQDALKSSRGNIAKAARSLSTTERILAYKIKNFSIDAARFKR